MEFLRGTPRLLASFQSGESTKLSRLLKHICSLGNFKTNIPNPGADLSRGIDRNTALFLLGAIFEDGFFPTAEGDVVVFSFSCGVVAKFFFITLLKQVRSEEHTSELQ